MPDVFSSEGMLLIGTMLSLGAAAGFLAGLLGIGGGIVLVPGLYYAFTHLGYGDSNLMHLAVGTSLAIIIPTGLSSALAHRKKGAVRMELVRMIGPGIVIGVCLGSLIADSLTGQTLQIVFAIALCILAAIMQIDPQKFRLGDHLPRQPFTGLVGGAIGTLSSLMGVGGATMNVPFMSLYGVPIHQAVGTSSAMGPLIAIPGTIGFILIGWGETGLPPLSLGYISLLALMHDTPAAVLVAPLGAHVAHKVSVLWLRRIFTLFMVIVAMEMLHGALTR